MSEVPWDLIPDMMHILKSGSWSQYCCEADDGYWGEKWWGARSMHALADDGSVVVRFISPDGDTHDLHPCPECYHNREHLLPTAEQVRAVKEGHFPPPPSEEKIKPDKLVLNNFWGDE